MARLLKVRQPDVAEEETDAEDIAEPPAIDLEYGRKWQHGTQPSTEQDDG